MTIPSYRRYFVFAVLLLVSALYQLGHSVSVVNRLRFETERAREPFQFGFRMRAISGMTREAYQAGIRMGDVLEEVRGRPFTGVRILRQAVEHERPGSLLPVKVRKPSGAVVETSIRLAPQRERPPPLETGPPSWPSAS